MEFNVGDVVCVKESYSGYGKSLIGKTGIIIKKEFDCNYNTYYFLINFEGYTPQVQWSEHNLRLINKSSKSWKSTYQERK